MTAALMTGAVSLIVAVISGAIAVWSIFKTGRNSKDIQSLKGEIDRDLERLRRLLEHAYAEGSLPS